MGSPPNTENPQAPVTVKEWRGTRPKSRSQTERARTALHRARQRLRNRKKRAALNIEYQDEIVVLGERVRLNELGVSEEILRQNVAFAEFVYFTPAYFPNEPAGSQKVNEAKLIFSKLFTPGSGFEPGNPRPPCRTDEFTLLKEGISNRFQTLRTDVLARRDKYGDSIYTREGLERLLVLKNIVNDFDSNERECLDYDIALEKGTIAERLKPLGNLDQERIKALIRQFSFLVLQAMNPIKGYRTDDAVEFVLDLEEGAISKEALEAYVADYTVSGFQVPESITHALEASGNHKDIYSGMLEKELQNLLKFIVGKVQTAIKDTGLIDEFNTFVLTITGREPREQLSEILSWVVGHYRKSHKIHTEMGAKLRATEETAASIRKQHAEATAGIRELEFKKNKLEEEGKAAAAAITELNSQAGLSEEELEKMKRALESRNAAAEADIKKIQEELALAKGSRDSLSAEQEKLTKQRQDAESAAAKARLETAGLQSSMVVAGDKLKKAEEENARIKEELKGAKAELVSQVKKIRAEYDKKVSILSNEIQLDKRKIADLTTKLSTLHPSSGQVAKNNVAKAFTDLRKKLGETMGPSRPTSAANPAPSPANPAPSPAPSPANPAPSPAPSPANPAPSPAPSPANPINNHTEETLKALDFNGLIRETERLIKDCEKVIKQKQGKLAKLTQSGGAEGDNAAPAPTRSASSAPPPSETPFNATSPISQETPPPPAVAALNKEISELNSTLDKLKKSLETLKGVANNRGSTMAEAILQGQIATLTKEKHDLEARVTTLEADLKKAKDKVDPKIAEKQTAIDAIQKKLDEMTTALGKQQADSQAALKKAKTDSDATIAPLNDEIKRLKSVIAANGISLTNRQKELLDLKHAAEIAKTTHNDLLSQLEPLKKQVASAAKDPSGNLIPSAKYTQLLADIAKAETDLTTATNNIATKTGEINTLKESLKVKGLQLVQATTDNTNKQNQINSLQSTINTLNIQLQQYNNTLADINQRLKLKDKDLAETQAELKRMVGVEKESDALKDKLSKLTDDCAKLRTEKERVEAQLNATHNQITGHGTELETLQKQVRNTVAAAEAQRTGLLTKVKDIANAIQRADGGQSLGTVLQGVKGFNDDGAFYELYRRMEDYDNKIKSQVVTVPGSPSLQKVETRDICYLNYFVGFFIKQIFFTPPFLQERKALYGALDQYINKFLSDELGRGLHLGEITSECFQLLYAAETFFLSQQRPAGQIATVEDERYHVIEGAESSFLKKFYQYVIKTGSAASLASRIEVYVQQAFPDYFFNTSIITYMPPFGDTAPLNASPGFTLLTDDDHVVDKSAYVLIKKDGKYERVSLGNTTVLNPVTENKFITYPTLLALYVLFARRYLVSIGDTLKKYHCPLSIAVQNPPAIQDTVEEPREAKRVTSYMSVVDPKTIGNGANDDNEDEANNAGSNTGSSSTAASNPQALKNSMEPEEKEAYDKLSPSQKNDYDKRVKPTIGLNSSMKTWRDAMSIVKGRATAKGGSKGTRKTTSNKSKNKTRRTKRTVN